METRVPCRRCKERLIPASTKIEEITCPKCNTDNPDRTLRKRSSSREHGRITSPPIGSNSMREKVRKFLLGGGGSSSGSGSGSGTQKSAASGSSLSKNYSKSRALDHTPGPSGKKRAVLCGVSYKKWKYRLKGTINDVLNMKKLLMDIYEFREENIRVLTEEESDAGRIPTKANIEHSLKWLVTGCQSGDSLVFYYSGHGLRQPDFNNDERDGFDETICPVDFLKEGMILDNDIYATIVKPLPEGVTLHAIVDACHSGTILDLEHVYDKDQEKWIDNKPPSGARKQTSGGKAYSISACEDDQVAADTSAFSSKSMNGAMTFILINVVRTSPIITYGDLLDKMHEEIERANQQGCLGGSRILSRIFGPIFTQKPLLSASEEFPVYERPFKL